MISWKLLLGLYQLAPWTDKKNAKVAATGNLNMNPWAYDLIIGPIIGYVSAHPKIKWASDYPDSSYSCQ